MYETLSVDSRENRVTVMLNRPEKKNAMTTQMFNELHDVFSEFNKNDDLDVVAVRGAEGHFSSGVDMSPILEWAEQNPLEIHNALRSVHEVLHLIESLDVPVVAALEGYVLGGALELSLACDIRLAHPDASFGLPESNFGLAIDLGGAQKLPSFIGEGMTKYLIMTGETIGAERAYDIGLVEQLATDSADFEDQLEALEVSLAEKPTYIHSLAKEQVHSARPLNLEEAMNQALFHATSAYKEPETKSRVREFLE
jgi:enoyl-CoA hydratase